jgi:hypothetical protein
MLLEPTGRGIWQICHFSGPICILGPKRTAAGNGCNLKPFEPEVLEKALLLVVAGCFYTLQVVYSGPPYFQ